MEMQMKMQVTKDMSGARSDKALLGDPEIREILAECGLTAPREAHWLFDRLLGAQEGRP